MRWQAFAIVILLNVLCADAFAQTQSEEFEELLKEGTVFFDATDYDRALDRFQKARLIYDHPRLRIQIGKTYEKLNKCAAAKELYFGVVNDEAVERFERDRAKARLAVVDQECSENAETTENETIESPENSDTDLSATTEPPPRRNLLLPILGGSLTTVGVVGMIVGVVKTSSDRSKIDDAWTELADLNGCRYDPMTDNIFDCPQPGLENSDAYNALADEVRSTNTANALILVGSGVFIATGVTLLIVHFVSPPDAPADDQPTVEISPVLRHELVGASLHVSF